ncbi:MAG: ABC transporter ATP-binding protein [Bacteroidota bacterium]
MVPAPLLELKDIRRGFREGNSHRTVLDGLDFSVEEGAFIVLLGRSGSGKSTLLNIVSGIDLPEAGDVRFQGASLRSMSEEDRTIFRRRHIGFVFQSFNLIPTLTVEENIRMPLELNRLHTYHDRVGGLLEEVGLADRAGSYPDRLSGGEQQRVAVARALVHEPDLLLADEPTGNLDADTADDVLGLIDRLVRQQNRTMIVATHDQTLRRLADRVVTLDHGKLIETARSVGEQR